MHTCIRRMRFVPIYPAFLRFFHLPELAIRVYKEFFHPRYLQYYHESDAHSAAYHPILLQLPLRNNVGGGLRDRRLGYKDQKISWPIVVQIAGGDPLQRYPKSYAQLQERGMRSKDQRSKY
jgi:hypothetical protein